MTVLVRKYSLFYLLHMLTFFFLCAYSLATNASNFPYLPAMFLPVYLSSAVALSERETSDPLMGTLPITPGDIMRVKFILAIVFVVISWLNMAIFTALQGLPSQMAETVMKLNTLSCIYTLLLAGAFQVGIHFFGWHLFQKLIILFIIGSSIFDIAFFVGLSERGINYSDLFPLVPFLESLPGFLIGILVVGAGAVFYLIHRAGPWNGGRWTAG